MGCHVRLQDGSFGYSRRPIFSGLDLELAAGETLCLLGPNGCGKTTLLRCMSGILPLQQGCVRLDGQDVRTMGETERARRMGFVFQDHALPFPYPVLEMVRMGRAPHLALFAAPSRRDTEIAEQALATVGIPHLSDKRYTEISGGERQLALIARALAQEPAVLLLDEPTSHLDFGNQMRILSTITRLVEERHLTVVMATHFPGHALLVAGQVALMDDGGLVRAGPAGEVLTEGNLTRLYGVDVRIAQAGTDGNGRPVRAIIPMLNRR
jgi:iron complex transport system ATP-binding protein